MPLLRCLLPWVLLVVACGQRADPDYEPWVRRPAWPEGKGPRVLFDEGHQNAHRLSNRYSPFANLLSADGYRIEPLRGTLSASTLANHDVLVIVNARAPEGSPEAPAFSEAEVSSVATWLEGGGALLLVTDHAPADLPARPLAERLGVRLGGAEVNDPLRQAPESRDPSELLYSLGAGLGHHPILAGRDRTEALYRVQTFTGQSLAGPPSSTKLLELSEAAQDVVYELKEVRKSGLSTTQKIFEPVAQTSAAGKAQAIAMTFGRGRVVVTGEAAMLTAQISEKHRFGMNLPGIDNQQFVLNVFHWLSGLLPASASSDGRE
jgi:hypothetical protein